MPVRKRLLGMMMCAVLLPQSGGAIPAWIEEKGSNFTIFYRDAPEHFVRTVMDEAETNYRRVAENLGLRRYEVRGSENRIAIYIYANQEDYIANAGQAGWSHGAASAATRSIHTFPSDSGFFDSILPHELGHILLHELTGRQADLPLWFEEGVAMYQEKARRMGAHDIVRQAIKNGQFIPLTRLADMRLYKNTDDAVVAVYYAEAASVVNYLITEFGEGRFYKLCRALKDGTPFVIALPAIYTRINNLERLNTQWVQFLEGE